MGAYVAQVDRVLAAGQGLFPASTGPGSVGGGEPGLPPPPPKSGLNVGVTGAGENYRQSWRGVCALDVQTNGGAAAGKAENERGQEATHERWAHDGSPGHEAMPQRL